MDIHKKEGISVLACTNKIWYAQNIMQNFHRQKFKNKELVLILNNNTNLQKEQFKRYVDSQDEVQIHLIYEKKTLGACLNLGVQLAKYEYVTKMDDDDYYGEGYLEEIYDALYNHKGDIVGKDLYLTNYCDDNELYMNKNVQENKKIYCVTGSTISFSKSFFQKIQYRDVAIGEDSYLFRDANEMGYTVYAVSKNDYLIIRYNDLKRHNWKTKYVDRLYKDPMRNILISELTKEQALTYTIKNNGS